MLFACFKIFSDVEGSRCLGLLGLLGFWVSGEFTVFLVYRESVSKWGSTSILLRSSMVDISARAKDSREAIVHW